MRERLEKRIMKQATSRSLYLQLSIGMLTLLMILMTVFGVEASVYAKKVKTVDYNQFCQSKGFNQGSITFSTKTVTCLAARIDPKTGQRLPGDRTQDFSLDAVCGGKFLGVVRGTSNLKCN